MPRRSRSCVTSTPAPASRYRWTVLSAGVFAQAAYAATGLGLPAIAPAIRHDFGLTLTQTGVVLAAGFLGSLATLLLWGIVADVVGERVVIAAGQAMTAAALIWAGYASSFVELVTAIAVAGGRTPAGGCHRLLRRRSGAAGSGRRPPANRAAEPP